MLFVVIVSIFISPCGAFLSILVISFVAIEPIWFVLSKYTAVIIQFLSTVNSPVYAIPLLALGIVSFVVYFIV